MGTWEKIALKIIKGEKNIPSPFNKDGVIQHALVMVKEEGRRGYLIMWCSVTLKGRMISSLTVPYGVDYLTSEQFIKTTIPEIKYE